MTSSRVRPGCAGWSIPSRLAHLFGEGDSHLARYATRFDVVEINSTFHRPHQARTFERWAASVPRQFRFSAKLPRGITHDARLHGTGDALTEFFDAMKGEPSALTELSHYAASHPSMQARIDRLHAAIRASGMKVLPVIPAHLK